jgi:squalene cyclase
VSPTRYTHTCNRLTSSPRICLQQAIGYLHRAQQPEGGWVGSWGICFTYAAQFALESLSLVGETYATSKYSRKGCEFLLKHQREDGGWGESWEVRWSLTLACERRAADFRGSSLVLRLSGLRRRRRKWSKPPGRLWASCTPNTLTPSPSSGPSSS